MEASTKYIEAFEDFDQAIAPEPVKAELTPPETIEKIWKVIDSGGFFGIISSYNPGNDPDVLDKEFESLQKDILKMKYAYLEQSFGYQYSDGNGLTTIRGKSLFVPMISYKELLSLGKKYDQETVVFGGNGKMDVLRVSDESILKTFDTRELKLAWNLLLINPHNIPW